MLETGTSGLMSGDEKRDGVSASAPALVLDSTIPSGRISVSGRNFWIADQSLGIIFQGTIPNQLRVRNGCSPPCIIKCHCYLGVRRRRCFCEECTKLSEIESMLRGSGELRQNIVRSLGSSTVALFAIFDDLGKEQLKLL